MTTGRGMRFGIVLEADGKGFRGEIRASEKELSRLRDQFGRGSAGADRFSRAQKEVERQSVPRTRGDEPREQDARARASACSPHTRG